jgi:formylglycine-generating enzyme required for sulfatase activity
LRTLAPAILAILAVAGLVGGCAREDRSARLVFELERMAFVAPGRCTLEGRPSELRGVDLARALRVSEPLLVDRFEATRDDWRHHMGRAPEPRGLADPLATTSAADGRGAWPAFADLDEARAFAAARGMRLLSAGEWVYVAGGAALLRYPFGASERRSVANTLELGLARPVPVGTFESGVSWSGCYDLVGNAMEWVEGSLPPAISVEWSSSAESSAMGGSYLGALLPTFSPSGPGGSTSAGFNGVPLPPRSRSVDLGVRCAVEAEPFLREHFANLAPDAPTRARLVAVGQRFGRAAVPLLERLSAEAPDDSAVAALLAGASQ